ncbi:hypothetical protein ABDK00_001965 [Niabella insulamsoli]|uniref:hypothetical protein n=1 Tax=Niabella insulamsoli TaxID=3144874 RepID=UPI0031FC6878
MRKLAPVFLLLIFNTLLFNNVNSAPLYPNLSFEKIGKLRKDKQWREIILLLYDRYYHSSTYDDWLVRDVDSLKKLRPHDFRPLTYLAKSLIYRRKQQFTAAERALETGIALVSDRRENPRLMFALYTTFAYTQTGKGNALGAIHNYRLAAMKAAELKDRQLQIIVGIGIADIYGTLRLFNHALLNLNNAYAVCNNTVADHKLYRWVIVSSKIDIFFSMRNADSVRFYCEKAKTMDADIPTFTIEKQRREYYLLMLDQRYRQAIPKIKAIISPSQKYYRQVDKLNLATCYLKSNQRDSALAVAKDLITDSVHNHAYIKIKSFQLLSDMSRSEGNLEDALRYESRALQVSEDAAAEMSKVNDLASQIRVDQIATGHRTQAAILKKERAMLIFGLIATALSTIVIGLFYRNVRQKHKYEKLLAESRDRELTFLNSHKSRKNLANILGLCDLAKEGELSRGEMTQYFKYINASAEEMDEWIQELDRKLAENQSK